MNTNAARATLVAFFAVGMLPVAANAQTALGVSGSPVTPGQTVLVVGDTGAKVKGRVAEASTAEIVLLTPDRRVLAMDSVDRIKRIDSVWNGALIGAGIGLAPAIAIWIAGACGGDYRNSARNCAIGAGFVAAGALGGAAMDMAISKTVYRSARARVKIMPNLSPSRSSLSLAIDF